MTDQELCRLVAEKVMGWTAKRIKTGLIDIMMYHDNEDSLTYAVHTWNPLHDGGQALEIQKKLKIGTAWDRVRKFWIAVDVTGNIHIQHEELERAIVLCAVRCVGVRDD